MNKFQQKQHEEMQRRGEARKKKAKEAAEDTTEHKPTRLGRIERELFRGAGTLTLDWENIKGSDFDDKVVPWLKEVSDEDEKLKRLDALEIEFNHVGDKVARRIQEEEQRILQPSGWPSDYRSRQYLADARDFGARLKRERE